MENLKKLVEEWKDIKNFPGYMISNTGKIVSFKTDKFKPIKIQNRGGYASVSLCRKNVVAAKSLGKLIAEHFLPNSNNRKHVKFKDGNKFNCHVSNLEWCDKSTIEKDIYDGRRERFLARNLERNQ